MSELLLISIDKLSYRGVSFIEESVFCNSSQSIFLIVLSRED